ncbi:MAG: thiamine pyrophosphate-dependent enzyme [Candidatus Thorarchaeota archaeon]
MSGNEAIARGALEAGVRFCASYPGTPSTEITEHIMQEAEARDIHAEWSTNEKVALEASAAASWAGLPALCAMKSLGLNVAADFLLNVNLSGTGDGGLVVVVCDDPKGHSSSNEQDSRFYAEAACLPLLEPSSCQQAKKMIPYAFNLSKTYETPVLVRSTTRLSHTLSLVDTGTLPDITSKPAHDIPPNLYNVPRPDLKHKDLLEKLEKIREEFEVSQFNELDTAAKGLRIISSGITKWYSEEAVRKLELRDAEVLTLGTSFPIPRKAILRALDSVDNILFTEEGQPFIEKNVGVLFTRFEEGKSLEIHGKIDGVIPRYGELNVDKVTQALAQVTGSDFQPVSPKFEKTAEQSQDLLLDRPPTFCPGCSHRAVYWAIKKAKQRFSNPVVVTGDIGCYSMGIFYDSAMDTMQAMGSSIGTASGLGQLGRFGFEQKVIAVAGDSTFFHACLPGLVSARNKNADLTFIIIDNDTTAMTGFQPSPSSHVKGTETFAVDIENLARSMLPDYFNIGDASDIHAMTDLIHESLTRDGLKIIVLKGTCRLAEKKDTTADKSRVCVDEDACVGEKCKICKTQFGCLAIGWNEERNHAEIIENLCVRCGDCVDVCPHDAIQRE